MSKMYNTSIRIFFRDKAVTLKEITKIVKNIVASTGAGEENWKGWVFNLLCWRLFQKQF